MENQEQEPLVKIQLEKAEVTLLGTAHISKASAEKVKELQERLIFVDKKYRELGEQSRGIIRELEERFKLAKKEYLELEKKHENLRHNYQELQKRCRQSL